MGSIRIKPLTLQAKPNWPAFKNVSEHATDSGQFKLPILPGCQFLVFFSFLSMNLSHSDQRQRAVISTGVLLGVGVPFLNQHPMKLGKWLLALLVAAREVRILSERGPSRVFVHILSFHLHAFSGMQRKPQPESRRDIDADPVVSFVIFNACVSWRYLCTQVQAGVYNFT